MPFWFKSQTSKYWFRAIRQAALTSRSSGAADAARLTPALAETQNDSINFHDDSFDSERSLRLRDLFVASWVDRSA